MSPVLLSRSEMLAGSPAAAGATIPARTDEPERASKVSRKWRVIKLGGTSVADPRALDHVVRAVTVARGDRSVVLVVSALRPLTDRLAALVDDAVAGAGNGRRDPVLVLAEIEHQHLGYLGRVAMSPWIAPAKVRLTGDLGATASTLRAIQRQGQASAAMRAQVLAMGERLAVSIVTARLASAGLAPEAVDACELIEATGTFLDAEPDLVATHARARRRLGAPVGGCVAVVPGFFATGADGRLRLLGRGGSDTSATTLGAALEADRVEIWTDVDGVCPADPGADPTVRPFSHLTYEQAERLAAAGARVLHTKAIAPLRHTGIPLIVRNAFRPEVPGTCIGGVEPWDLARAVEGEAANVVTERRVGRSPSAEGRP